MRATWQQARAASWRAPRRRPRVPWLCPLATTQRVPTMGGFDIATIHICIYIYVYIYTYTRDTQCISYTICVYIYICIYIYISLSLSRYLYCIIPRGSRKFKSPTRAHGGALLRRSQAQLRRFLESLGTTQSPVEDSRRWLLPPPYSSPPVL